MPLDTARIQALCFDVDGTLSDTDEMFVQRLSAVLQIVRFLFPGRDVRPFARRLVMATESPANFVFGLPDRLGLDDQLAVLGDWIYRLGIVRHPRPFLIIPGVQEMLAQLHGRFPMAVVSARGVRNTQAFLKQFELTPYFQSVVTALTCEHTKPYPDPVLYAARQMGVPPENCLMIGDTTVDILAGIAAGAQTAGVLCGFGQHTELRRAGAHVILPTTPLLTEILKI